MRRGYPFELTSEGRGRHLLGPRPGNRGRFWCRGPGTIGNSRIRSADDFSSLV